MKPNLLALLALITMTTRNPAAPTNSLASAMAPFFTVGVAVDRADLAHPRVWALVTGQVNAVTLENAMKPALVQPEPGRFTFERADELVQAARDAGLRVHGHTLVWHRQTPEWFFTNQDGTACPPERLRERLHSHVRAVATHFRGKVDSWDVANEVLRDGGGEDDFRDSAWWNGLGFSYILDAFLVAAEADPDALLFYNDYGLETEPKRSRALRLIAALREGGARVDGIGMQAHLQLNSPPVAEIEKSILAFRDAGLKVHISELDVSLLPWRTVGSARLPEDEVHAGGLSPEMQDRLAQRYTELFALFRRHHESVWRVTFWNTHDGRSWLNNFPVEGRVDHPLLFDRALQPKPAYYRVVNEAIAED